MWQKRCALLVGLVAVAGFGWVSAQEPMSDGSSAYYAGSSYILKAGDRVSWPSGHSWYFCISSTRSYPLKVTTTNSSGKAIYAKAPSGGYALYADGRVRAKSFHYSTPRTHVLSVGSEAFVPDTNAPYFNSGNPGGAYINTTGGHAMVASINLPNGAVLTRFKVFFEDNSAPYYLIVYLFRQNLGAAGYRTLTSVNSSGITGYGSKETTAIVGDAVDNTAYGYHINAYGGPWDPPNMKIKGAVIWYTTTQPD